MKNIFKFMGIALLASSMMVACGDKDNSDDNGGNTNIPEGLSITLGGQVFLPEVEELQIVTSNNNIGIFAFESEESYIPGFEAIIKHGTTGTFTESINADGEFASGDIFYAFVDAYLYRGQEIYGDWWAKSHKTTIDVLDLNSLKATFSTEGVMFDANTAFVEEAGIENADTQSFTVSAGNVSLEELVVK